MFYLQISLFPSSLAASTLITFKTMLILITPRHRDLMKFAKIP